MIVDKQEERADFDHKFEVSIPSNNHTLCFISEMNTLRFFFNLGVEVGPSFMKLCFEAPLMLPVLLAQLHL